MEFDDRFGPPEPPAPEPAPAPTPARPRRSRWDLVLVVVCVALLVGAGLAAAGARTSSSQAGADRTQAARVDGQRATLAAKDLQDEHRVRLITSAMSDLNTSLHKLSTDFGTEVDALNHFVDVANQSVTLFNHGGVSSSVGQFKAQGQPALDDVTTNQATVDADLTAAQAAIAHLEGVLHG